MMDQAPARTQDERSAAMRARLIDATLESMLECGYARTTMVEIVERAGVTRGALNHHYQSKDDLIVEAVSYLLQKTSAEIREFAQSVQEGSITLSDFLDRGWEIFSGPFFMVTLEQITASRHNEMLRERLILVTREFHKALDDTWNSFFSNEQSSDPQLETIFNATLCLLRGMGVQTVLRNDPEYYQRLLTFWKDMLMKRTSIKAKPAANRKTQKVIRVAANHS